MAFDPKDVTLDPLQGMDIRVSTVSALSAGTTSTRAGGVLVGAFTSAMFKIVNQTETYLPLNQRIPRHLDGEIIIVYALEQGLVDPAVMTNTFGEAFATALGLGRGFKIPRSSRFNIKFGAEITQDLQGTARLAGDPAIFNNPNFITNGGLDADGQPMAGTEELKFTLKNCRVDTFSFGMTSGRHIVANSWQGTAEALVVNRSADNGSVREVS